MVVVCNGDSWTQGDSPSQSFNWNVEKSEMIDNYMVFPNFADPYMKFDDSVLNKFYCSPVWPKVLATTLGVKTYNVGRLGRSNTDILLTTINAVNTLLKSGETELVVIVGWSSLLRKSIFCYDGKDDKVKPIQIRPLTEGFEHMYDNITPLEDDFALCIYTLQEFLKSKRIDFVFFNAFDSFTNYSKTLIGSMIDKSKWIESDIKSPHFRNFIEEEAIKNNTTLEDTEYIVSHHPTDNSHTLWGNHLSQLIENNVKKLY